MVVLEGIMMYLVDKFVIQMVTLKRARFQLSISRDTYSLLRVILSWDLCRYITLFERQINHPINLDYGGRVIFLIVLVSLWICLRSNRTSFRSALTLSCPKITEPRCALLHQLLAFDNSQ